MEVITTHVNADFDCLGAMVAAKKLYPDAAMVFSGSQEKSMRDFFLKSTGFALDFKKAKDLDLSSITLLIIVDCQHSSRIGRFSEVVSRPGVTFHIYDHHPEIQGDIRPSAGEICECGSSTTILTKILMEKNISVTPTEATLMMLGIYEDTGNLTFPSTTVDDYRAAAWLLERGASLNTVSDFITQELTAEQVSLLNDLLKSLKTTTINGVDISIAQASVDYYIGDIAVLSHMIRDMENLDALFLAVDMGKRVFIVARSRLPEVDVGAVLREFGGGGHAHAASATVKDLTLIQVMSKLHELLHLQVNPKRTAADIMSAPVKSVSTTATISDARDLLTRYNVNAMPVLCDGEMVGIISRRIVEKSLYHHLGDLPVTEYMHTEFLRAVPETPLSEIQDYIVGRERRLVPVFKGNILVGVITRTDLLRVMYAGVHNRLEGVYDMARDEIPVRKRHLENVMQKRLSPEIFAKLRELGETGDLLDLPVYVVGGFVRDLLLGAENLDIDVTVEGDGILFAETLAKAHGCRVKSHHKFGTAVIVFPDGFKIDVASTRLEFYSSPGALPTVERSSLKMDLYRRDFTINTLAIRLNKQDFGVLVDYFSAQRDLNEKVIRVLHNLSFVEDPTRVFRALRFEQRLDFRIAKHTENLIINAVKMNFLSKLGGKRLLTELVIILKEKDPLRAIERMASLGLLQFIHPDLKLTPEIRHLLGETVKIIAWFELLYLERPYEKWVIYFLSLCDPLSTVQFMETCTRLSLSEQYRKKLFELRNRIDSILDSLQRRIVRGPKMKRSEIYFLLNELPVEILLFLMVKAKVEGVKKFISLYFTQLQGVRTAITGEDLKELGVVPGPAYKKILDRVFRAKLDDETLTREDEIRIARKEAGKHK
ncbi:MAG: CBS domain-containing protein [Deltaproteobacteria bacterium]|nr:CBS domain-containing protein [Deltaproteobacteria bacterium]TLN03765.1 MAG: CBS domain-containing protein [bacterium]